MCQIIVHLCNYSEVEFRCLLRAHSTIPYNLCASSILIHFAQSALKIISKSMRFGTPHSPNTFILAELISNEAQPVPVQTPQQPQRSFHASHPVGKQISAAVLATMTATGNGCKSGVSSRSATANRWRGSDSESESESPAPAALINHCVCTRPRPRATWKICRPARLCEAAASEEEEEEEAEGFGLLRVVDNLQLVAFSEGQVRRRP